MLELHFKENLHTIYVMSWNTLEIYISGIMRDFKSCMIRDSAGIVVQTGAWVWGGAFSSKWQKNGLNSSQCICFTAIWTYVMKYPTVLYLDHLHSLPIRATGFCSSLFPLMRLRWKSQERNKCPGTALWYDLCAALSIHNLLNPLKCHFLFALVCFVCVIKAYIFINKINGTTTAAYYRTVRAEFICQ